MTVATTLPDEPDKRPDLHIVPNPDTTDTVPEPPEADTEITAEIPAIPVDGAVTGGSAAAVPMGLAEVPADTQAQAPWQYRIHGQLSEVLAAAPGFWTERRPSFSERVAYSQHADWAVAESGVKRTAHLIGTLLMLLPAAIGVALASGVEKPSRGFLAIAFLILLGYALT